MESVEAVSVETVAVAPTRAVATGRYLFGHQSVGGNVLAGVAGLPGAPAVLDAAAVSATSPGIHHFALGRNGDPESKLAAFVEAVDRLEAMPDAALMKFCYVDVNGATDASRLFEAYRARMAELRERHPGLVLVHVTMPLTADRGTLFHWRTVLRGGGERSDRRLNAIRHRYNELLRAEYGGREPIFDLAREESTRADGTQATVRYGGERVPVLAREYTNDGGHLNEAGRRRTAEALLATLASLPAAR